MNESAMEPTMEPMPPPVYTDADATERMDLLIADYLEPDPADPRPTAYRLRGSHLPVRDVVRQVGGDLRGTREIARQVGGGLHDTREIARELGVYHRAVDAAVAHYTRHRDAFIATSVRPSAPAPTARGAGAPVTVATARPSRPPCPWWLEALLIVALGVVCMCAGIGLAIWLN